MAVRTFFILACAITWGIGLIGLIVAQSLPGSTPFAPDSPFYWLAGYAVSALGVIMTIALDGRAGLARLGQRLVPDRWTIVWVAAVVVLYALLTLAARSAAEWRGLTVAPLPPPTSLLSGLALALVFDVGPCGEELGWRGFALPRLLERRTALVAAVMLGGVHALWHVPLFFIPAMPQSHLSFPPFAAGVVGIAVIDTWIYLRTKANLLLAILVHLLANYCGGLFDPAALPWFFAAEAAAAAAIIAAGGLRRQS